MGIYRYSEDSKRYENTEEKKCFEVEKEEKKEICCDPESAKALKKILSLVDDLNKCDLKILNDVIDRLLCLK